MHCMKPKVSILTSIYKSADFLYHFMLDVRKQSIFSEIEVVLLDANDDDEDFKIIEPFLVHKNFVYHKIGKCNVYEAWNKGIDIASSDLLSNWNTDDRRKYNSLGVQVDFLNSNPNTDVCYGKVLSTHVANESFNLCSTLRYYPTSEGSKEMLLKNNSPHCFPMWRKSIHKRFGYFNTKYFSAADYEMWFRVLNGGGTLSKMEDIVGSYYENPNSISRKLSTFNEAVKEVFQIRDVYR